MEFRLSFQTAIAGTILASLLLILYHLLDVRRVAKKSPGSSKIAPRAAGAWPIIGHLHLLARSRQPHVLLGDMAHKHGPIFSIKLGVHEAFVVSDWKLAKECFTTYDKAFASRPKSAAIELMGYNYATYGLGPYGHYWRYMHKIIKRDILSNNRVKMLSQIQVSSEVKEAIKDVYQSWLDINKGYCSPDLKKVKMEMKQWFESLSINMVVRMIAGKRYNRDDQKGRRALDAVRKFFELLGAPVVSDVFPFLRWLDLGGYVKKMKIAGKEIDYILTKWLEEHKIKKENCKLSEVNLEGEEEDLMDVILSSLEGSSDEDLAGYGADTVNKATCLTILVGATHSTSATLTWILSLLLKNRHALEKAQNELDIQVGRNRQVGESDIKNLVYLQAILKEAMRLSPGGPLTAMRECIEDCTVGGYKISKGSRLIVNRVMIHCDPQLWLNPSEFQPERFLTRHKDVDIRGQHFELQPFGAGRRTCPGISLATQAVLLTLASLIHGFDLSTPMDEQVDLNESSGQRATEHEVFLSPRLYSYE